MSERRGFSRVRKAFASKGDDATLSRWVKVKGEAAKPPRPYQLKMHGLLGDAVALGRSRFYRKGVKSVDQVGNVLVSGRSNVKIGRDVRKGWARGYWIYTLSLEERATCPTSCRHWASCYGNNMPYAKRVDHRDAAGLLIALEREVARLVAVKGRVGVMVRLHALGDFFDPRYVRFWGSLLERYPTLAIYGYAAWPRWSPIGVVIAETKEAYGRRFAIRWSNGRREADCTVPIRHIDEAVNATVCPEQTGRTAACATCGLCWGSTRNIAFLEH